MGNDISDISDINDNRGVIRMPSRASMYCSRLDNIKYNVHLERNGSSIIVFKDYRWNDEWSLYRTRSKKGKYLWLVDIEKALVSSSKSFRLEEESEITILESKCKGVNADFAIINSGYLCKEFSYDRSGAVCILSDKTIVHASMLLEEDWENQLNALKAAMPIKKKKTIIEKLIKIYNKL